MFKKLSEATGSVTDNSPNTSDSDAQIVRSAILVHAGPNGEALTFQSADGPIAFDSARIKNIVEVHNAYMDSLAKQYGGEDKIPMGANEPILDSHESDSNNRIVGRLTGKLEFQIRNVPKIGENVPCAVAVPGITFLGKDTVDRVNDGRIYHLSIGINEQDNRIGETSTVVKPAAPGAMLLKQGSTKKQGGINMSVDIKRMKAHAEKLAKLSAIKDSLSSFTKTLVASSDSVRLAAKKGQITHRLTTAIKSGKMTPAEFKELSKNDGLTHLASLDDKTLTIALLPFEARQHSVIHVGQIGSSSSGDAADFAKQLTTQKSESEYKRLRAETRGDIKRLSGKELSEDDKEKEEVKKDLSGPKESPVSPGSDEHVVPGQAGDQKELAHHLGELGKHLAAGDLDSAKKSHAEVVKMAFPPKAEDEKKMSEFSGDVKSEDYQKSMGDMQMQVDEMKTQMSRMAGMVEEMMSAESEEGKHFGEISEEHSKVAG